MTSPGSMVAKVLSCSWREHIPPVDISAEQLAQVAPILLSTGTAALGWRRVRGSGLESAAAAVELRQAHRIQAINTAVYEHQIRRVVKLCRADGLEPALVKGWAISRLYPEKGLRPYGDIDLCFRPDQYQAAEKLFADPDNNFAAVDLHRGFDTLDDHGFDELFARTRLTALDDVEVRVLAPEDHLRILCLHLLRHGAWRPLWLCDIGLSIESRPADFDWDVCLGEGRHAEWVACTVGLACQLLGARADEIPVAARSRNLPRWLAPNVLKLWGQPYDARAEKMAHYVRKPKGVLRAVRKRWPDPIIATVSMRGPFNNMPRLPFQIGNYLSRTARFLTRLPKSLRAQK